MVGLGPIGSSLLERTGKKFELTEDWLILDRQERSQARRAAVIKWSMKKKKTVKPVAPVEETSEGEGKNRRLWRWLGANNGMQYGLLYTAEHIRSYGFKLPRLKKKEGKKRG